MTAGDGEPGIGAQGNGPAGLARQGAQPVRPGFQNGGDGWMDGKADGAFLPPRLAQQRTRLERRPVGGKLEQGCVAPRPHDLQEAEAVDCGALERVGEDRVDGGADGGALFLALRRSAGRCRSSRRCRGAGSPAPPLLRRPSPARPAASVPSTSIRVMAGVGETRKAPPAKATMPLRASSSKSDQPASSSRSYGEGKGSSSASNRAALGPSLLSCASGRFQGSAPGIVSRTTSMAIDWPSVAPEAPSRSTYSWPSADAIAGLPARTRRAATIEPAGTIPSRRMRAATISPPSMRTARRLADAALDQPVRGCRIRHFSASAWSRPSGRPTTLE